jgi:PsbP
MKRLGVTFSCTRASATEVPWPQRSLYSISMRCTAFILFLTAFSVAQTAPAKKPSTPVRPHTSYYCNQDLGYCFDFPASWKMLGEVYEGHGASVAPVQPGDESQWAQVTVAAIEVPTEEGKNPPTVEDLVTTLVGKMAEQTTNMETVRRSEETLARHPAQLLQVHYDENGKRWGETIVAMDGGDGTFYTVVYKALAGDEAKYQVQVQNILKSFRLAP